MKYCCSPVVQQQHLCRTLGSVEQSANCVSGMEGIPRKVKMVWHCFFWFVVLFSTIAPAGCIVLPTTTNHLLTPGSVVSNCSLAFLSRLCSPPPSLTAAGAKFNWPVKTPSRIFPKPARVPDKSIFPYHFLCLDYPTGYDGIFGDRPPAKASSADGEEGKKRQLQEENKAEEGITEIKRNPIRLYISPSCPFCDKVMNFLHEEARLEKLGAYGMQVTPIRDLDNIYVVNIDGNRMVEKTGGKVQVQKHHKEEASMGCVRIRLYMRASFSNLY
eukprot:GHVS01099140.1.p1 GENE.GHVS01099140.1~~GHVS01099140.1.p1  ORF type:complete len:272 (+),score=48.92 GHVS01099140.1:54-869(+)